MSDDLTWQRHVDIKTSKANRTLGFIRRNLGECSKQVKVTAYTTMVRPTLEYSSTVWDPKSPTLCHKVEQVQRKAARFVHSSYTHRTPGCVTKMVQDLGWVSLEHRRYISRLMMLFKIHHQIVEVSGATEAPGAHTASNNHLVQLPSTGTHSFTALSATGTAYRHRSPTAPP